MAVNLRRIARRSYWNGISVTWSSLYPALALLLSAFAIAPLAYPGFFQSYTGYSAVYNLIDLHAHLTNFWAWSAVWGHPYDFLRMDGPLGYGLAEIFHLVGLSFLDAIKGVYALSFLFAAYGMFGLARRVCANDGAALLASIIYIYFPAHIAAVYVRGAFGEALGWGLFPLALWAMVALEAKPESRRREFILSVLAFAACMLAQPGLALLFGIFARVWLLVLGPHAPQERASLRGSATAAILLGLVLGGVLQIPSLLHQANLSNAAGFVRAFAYPFQFLSATWGSAVPTSSFDPALPDSIQAPYQIGIAALGLAILAAALAFRPTSAPSEATENSTRRLVLFTTIAGIILLLLMMPIAEPLWDFSGLTYFVQYPFELLLFVGFLLCFAGGSVILADVRFQDIPLLAALVIVPMLAVYPYLSPEFFDFSPTKPAPARFNEDEVALLDAKIIRPPGVWRHGATVELNLTWQALRQPNRDYTVFLHILDANGDQWGGVDEKPQGGDASTLKWAAGRVYSDTHSMQISLTGPPEGYHLELGLYQTTTGERAHTETGANEITIEENK